jgi:hypothetical protein
MRTVISLATALAETCCWVLPVPATTTDERKAFEGACEGWEEYRRLYLQLQPRPQPERVRERGVCRELRVWVGWKA